MTDAEIRDLLLRTRRIAVVGASDRPGRPSFGVFGFLRDRGYDAVPVNPTLAGRPVQGVASVAALADAAPLDMVDIFRRSADAGAVVDEAIRLGPIRLDAARRRRRGGGRPGPRRRPRRGDGSLPRHRMAPARPAAAYLTGGRTAA